MSLSREIAAWKAVEKEHYAETKVMWNIAIRAVDQDSAQMDDGSRVQALKEFFAIPDDVIPPKTQIDGMSQRKIKDQGQADHFAEGDEQQITAMLQLPPDEGLKALLDHCDNAVGRSEQPYGP